MFSMEKIGRKISELRKEKNMTQPELADMLGISFQAVSNWERGNSMPDISKLPELAEIFGVTVDELLGEKSVLVDAAINNKIEEVIESEEATEEEVNDVLPILKPNLASKIAKFFTKSGFSKVEKYIPYMDSEDIKALAFEAFENEESVEGFLPYLDEEDVKKIAFDSLEKGRRVEELLPYMSDEDVRELAFTAFDKNMEVEIFLPYLDNKDVGEIAKRAFRKNR